MRTLVDAMWAVYLVVVWAVVFFLLGMGADATADMYWLTSVSAGKKAEGSAVCVATRRGSKECLFLTAAHNLTRGATWVHSGEAWVRARNIRSSRVSDVASFTAASTAFVATPLLAGVPVGTPVTVRGRRSQPAFTGRLSQPGWVATTGQHVLPGDSGGIVRVSHASKNWCAGIVDAYHPATRQTHFVSAAQCRDHLRTVYREARCDRWGRCVVPPPAITRAPEVAVNSPEVIQSAVDKWMAAHSDQLRGPAGPAAEVSTEAVAKYLVAHHREELRGEPGEPGIVSQGRILGRIESLETQQRVVILRIDGVEVDRETLSPGDPLILDVRTESLR